MKELLAKAQNNINQTQLTNLSALSIHILTAALTFVAARGLIFETLMPFGLVFVGGCSAVFLPSAAIGAFVGYFLPATVSGGFKYIAALLAVVATRLLLASYRRISDNPFFLGAVAMLSNAATSLVSYSGVPLDIIKLIAECIIIFGSVFVVNRAFLSVASYSAGHTYDEMLCIIGTAVIVLIGLIDILVFNLSVGRIIGIFFVLCAARYGGGSMSSICGIALSFACTVTAAHDGTAGIYAFMGLASGIFRSLGKYAIAVSGLATGIIAISSLQLQEGWAPFLTEIIIAGLFFLLIPRSFGIYLSKCFYRAPKLNAKNDAAGAVSLRLQLASGALLDVSSTVAQVSEELEKINAPDFKTVLSYIEQDACAGCKLRLHCWENKHSSTIEAIMQMINSIKGGEAFDTLTLEEFRGRCIRIGKMQDAVSHRYSQYASHIAAEDRIREVRQVVSEQFEGISDMLNELSQNLTCDEHFNGSAAVAAASALKNLGIHTEECSAKTDSFGRMSLEIKIKLDDTTVLNRLQIMKILSLACERDFSPPNITKNGNSALITVNEHAALRIDIGIQQHCAVAGSVCGDAYKFFNDGKGHFIMILSDGMGTGGRAAVDGAMASGLMARLLNAGLGYDCSLKVLNSSMLFKSSDESLATLDIASIDLFSGSTKLYKAGAAPTIVRRSGHSGRAESQSLPIGILKEVSFDKAAIRLRHGDILLLVSDGATFDGTEWIRHELEAWGDGSAQDLAEHICDSARRRYTDSRPDDITVMAAIIEKND